MQSFAPPIRQVLSQRAYACRLIAAGVPTQADVISGAFHGFDHMGDTRLKHDFTAS